MRSSSIAIAITLALFLAVVGLPSSALAQDTLTCVSGSTFYGPNGNSGDAVWSGGTPSPDDSFNVSNCNLLVPEGEDLFTDGAKNTGGIIVESGRLDVAGTIHTNAIIDYQSGSSGYMRGKVVGTFLAPDNTRITYVDSTTIRLDFVDSWQATQAISDLAVGMFMYVEWTAGGNIFADNTGWIEDVGRSTSYPHDPGKWFEIIAINGAAIDLQLPRTGKHDAFACAECTTATAGGARIGGLAQDPPDGAFVRNAFGEGDWTVDSVALDRSTEGKWRLEIRFDPADTPFDGYNGAQNPTTSGEQRRYGEFNSFLLMKQGANVGTPGGDTADEFTLPMRVMRSEPDEHSTTGETVVVWSTDALVLQPGDELAVFFAHIRQGNKLTAIDPARINATGSTAANRGRVLIQQGSNFGIDADYVAGVVIDGIWAANDDLINDPDGFSVQNADAAGFNDYSYMLFRNPEGGHVRTDATGHLRVFGFNGKNMAAGTELQNAACRRCTSQFPSYEADWADDPLNTALGAWGFSSYSPVLGNNDDQFVTNVYWREILQLAHTGWVSAQQGVLRGMPDDIWIQDLVMMLNYTTRDPTSSTQVGEDMLELFRQTETSNVDRAYLWASDGNVTGIRSRARNGSTSAVTSSVLGGVNYRNTTGDSDQSVSSGDGVSIGRAASAYSCNTVKVDDAEGRNRCPHQMRLINSLIEGRSNGGAWYYVARMDYWPGSDRGLAALSFCDDAVGVLVWGTGATNGFGAECGSYFGSRSNTTEYVKAWDIYLAGFTGRQNSINSEGNFGGYMMVAQTAGQTTESPYGIDWNGFLAQTHNNDGVFNSRIFVNVAGNIDDSWRPRCRFRNGALLGDVNTNAQTRVVVDEANSTTGGCIEFEWDNVYGDSTSNAGVQCRVQRDGEGLINEECGSHPTFNTGNFANNGVGQLLTFGGSHESSIGLYPVASDDTGATGDINEACPRWAGLAFAEEITFSLATIKQAPVFSCPTHPEPFPRKEFLPDYLLERMAGGATSSASVGRWGIGPYPVGTAQPGPVTPWE